jgi:formylmethanofuran dehydrogenase subunit E
MVVGTPHESMLTTSAVFPYQSEEAPVSFDWIACEVCGELMVTKDARIGDGKIVCIPCSGYEK